MGKKRPDFPVVGIGTSAGGIKAPKEFFDHLPPDSGMAFVVVIHLDPEHTSSLDQLLERHTEMKVLQVNKKTRLKPNHVYLIVPGKRLHIQGKYLFLADKEKGEHATIDVFFRSLAEQFREDAICVILTGTGTDGTLGLKAIKEYGGVAIVQDPEEAEYSGMPLSAIHTGLVDLVLPLKELGPKVVGYKEALSRIELSPEPDQLSEKELEETNQKLEEAVKLRDEFLSIASHELQTPVTSVKTHIELFERQLVDAGDKDYAQKVNKINKRIDQLSSLICKLLDLSRMQQKELDLEKDEFSLDELIEETVDSLKHVSHHNIEIKSEGVKEVYADRFRIGQVLTNLLENAIKYSPDAEKVIVRVGQEKQNVIVSVMDFGIGILEADRKKVFERFFKGTDGPKKTYPGFGIGLYISRQIVERHDGEIRVEENLKGGSVFTFTLPQKKT